MKYLKVWTSFREVIRPLSDDEKGRLFDMMLGYAEDSTEPENFIGNERFVWYAAKQSIDLTAERNAICKRNGLKGGRPKTEENQTEPNESKENQTEPNESRKEKKRNEKKGNEKKRNENQLFERFWEAYPRHVNKQGAVKAFEKAEIDEGLLEVILRAVERQKASDQWTKDNGQFIPHPATWLNQRRWEDDIKPVKVLHAQDFDQRSYDGVNDELLGDLARDMDEFRKGAG